MIDRFFALMLLAIALVFAFTAVRGLRKGYTWIPMKLIEFEEFDRTENPANFWGVTVLNFTVATGLLVMLGYWQMNGMIE